MSLCAAAVKASCVRLRLTELQYCAVEQGDYLLMATNVGEINSSIYRKSGQRNIICVFVMDCPTV